MCKDDSRVFKINSQSPLFDQVPRLADAHSEFLGFFPESAFRASADSGRLLVHVDEGGHEVLGYVLFYVARGQAVVQQACVGPNARGHGVGRHLIDEVKRLTRHLDRIVLHCARKFTDAQKFWRSVGFIPVDEKPGRGKDQRPLTRFLFDHGSIHLWSSEDQRKAAHTQSAALDNNVFIDIYVESDSSHHESLALNAPWLEESITKCITAETFVELDRQEDPKRRTRSKLKARQMPQCKCDAGQVEAAVKELKGIFGVPASESQMSDILQVANAVAARADYFITRDGRVLNQAPQIRSQFGLEVLSPIQLITRFDQVRRRDDYNPRRLAGSDVHYQRLTDEMLSEVTNRYLSTGVGEKKHEFRTRLSQVLSVPSECDALHITAGDGSPQALFVAHRPSPTICEVGLLRLQKGPLAPTLTRRLLARAITSTIAVPDAASLTIMSDVHPSGDTMDALAELGFTRIGDRWLKLNVLACEPADLLLDRIRALESDVGDFPALRAELLRRVAELTSSDAAPESIARAESILFPARILDERLPCYIVPIQPRWAIHLFDEGLAAQELIPVERHLALRVENVYYRSAHTRIKAPSHVLWYVSADPSGKQNVRSIRAVSTVDEVIEDSPEALFERFERLGVYRLHDLQDIGSAVRRGRIQAFRFGLTTMFKQSVRRRDCDAIIGRYCAKIPQKMQPFSIPGECFQEIWQLGHGHSKHAASVDSPAFRKGHS